MSRFFSNGTEGRAWEALWCQRCVNDHSMHDEDGDGGCVHLLHALCREDDLLDGVWIDESERFGFTMPPAVRCVEFAECGPCGEHVTLDANGYPSPVQQREWMRPAGSTSQGVLITDRTLAGPVSEVVETPKKDAT